MSCGTVIAQQLLDRMQPLPSAAEPERAISGSVIGYRAFRILDWKLAGTGVSRTWSPGVNRATCNVGPSEDNPSYLQQAMQQALAASCNAVVGHDAPGEGCHCGITALARFTTKDDHWSGDLVYGAIEAWGQDDERDDGSAGFVLHRNGFRARYGKVVLLAIDDTWPAAKKAAVRALVAGHEADVCKREHLEDAAKEHGQLVPDELLAWAAEGDLSFGGGYSIPSVWLQQPGMSYFSTPASPQGVVTTSNTTAHHLRPGTSIGSRVTADEWPTKPKGIKETLGYVGPPGHGSHKRGDRVKDRRGIVYECVKGGKPGTWEQR